MITGAEPIMVGNYESVKVGNLHVVSGSMTTEYLFKSGILKQLRLLILNQYEDQETKINRKIYLKRPSNLFRPLQNEKNLSRFLQKNEFEIIEPSTISLAEQIKMIRSAKIIVAESGAALTNVMFAEDKTKLIELHPALDYSNFWRDYSSNFIQDYEKIYGKKRLFGRKGVARDGFVIEIQSLEKALNGPREKA
jgi:capsular polysaccharide biosynthesis protein